MSPTSLPLPDVGRVGSLSDDELLAAQRAFAAVRREVDAGSAIVAAEIGRRSARELGYAGLAQRSGARTAERLIAEVSGLSLTESRAMLAAGEVLSDQGGDWLRPVATSLEAGELSVGATAAIRSGLGEPNADVSADDLAGAAVRVAREAAGLSPERAAAVAREARDELDVAGVADRAAHLRAQRSLRIARQADGMTRLTALLDPENAALVTDAIDRVTSPRRGGVRFVSNAAQERARRIADDPRTTEQLALDALVEMVRLAGRVDDGAVFGERGPEVRVHVRASDLERGAGRVWIEGAGITGLTVAERLVCTVGALPIVIDERGRPLRLGRSQRLFSKAQRIAMAARDGGCLMPGCDRPPSWCEAHHIEEWERGGRTDVDVGVLLCRHHHMWVHDTGAHVERAGPEDGGALFVLVRREGRREPMRSRQPLRLAG